MKCKSNGKVGEGEEGGGWGESGEVGRGGGRVGGGEDIMK